MYPKTFRPQDRRRDSPQLLERKIRGLLRAMTWEEKCGLLGGSTEPKDKGKIGNAGYLWGVPRLGVPELVMYDGPAGITGIVETTGLPQPSLLGCTWDEDLAYAFGHASGSECAVCSGNVLLAPQVDVIRSPHFYRNKDMLSEDPYLCARLGAAETRGVQDSGVIATLKHFAAANLFGDDLHHFPKQYVDEQTLHELYCRPFEFSIRAGAGAVMNAYNDVNGSWISENRDMLLGILREQWQFEGAVLSDWGSVHSFTLDCGVDMEMPFPAYNAIRRIQKRIEKGLLTSETVEKAAEHVLRAMGSVGLLSLVQLSEEGNVLEEAGRSEPIQMQWRYEESGDLFRRNEEIAASIVREGTVLLKNENSALPLDLSQGKTVLIGLGSRYPICGEAQERSFGRLSRMVSGQEALEEISGKQIPAFAGIDYVGSPIPAACFYQDSDCLIPGLIRSYGILDCDRDLTRSDVGENGGGDAFTGETFLDEDGEIVDTGLDSYNAAAESAAKEIPGSFCCVDKEIHFVCDTKYYRNSVHGTALTDGKSYTWKGYLKVPENGQYSLILQSIGGQTSFFLQTESGWCKPGQSQMREWAQWPWESIFCTKEGMGVTSSTLYLKADTAYPIVLHSRPCVRGKDLQICLAWQTPSSREIQYQEAIRAAGEADSIIFFACDTHSGAKASLKRLEEQRLELDPEQLQLLTDTIAVKRPEAKLIVVLQTANAKAIGAWEAHADAILTTYMPGQEGNRVLAEILTGRATPSGKLSQTWPACAEDTPLTDCQAHIAQRNLGVREGADTVIRQTEGIMTGYRWHDLTHVPALYPFGHGLSYTQFTYSGLQVEGRTISLWVTNTGDRTGDEIVQCYVGSIPVPAHIQMAEKQLAGFVRLKDLKPGETREAKIDLAEEMLCYWDPELPLIRRPDGTQDKWVLPQGRRKIMVGSSSADIRLVGEIIVGKRV